MPTISAEQQAFINLPTERQLWKIFQGQVGSGLPYGADHMTITNVAAGPSVIVYKHGSTVLKTRTLTYTNSGASASDVLTNIADA